MDRITNAFGQLESYLKLNSGQNLNSPAGLAEDLCVPLLKLVYGYDLVNVNAEDNSAAAIDLLDRARRLAVQVTVKATAGKIRDTLRAIPKSAFKHEFDRIIILFLVRKAPAEPGRSGNFTHCATHTVTTLDIDSLISAIRTLELSAQEKIAEFLEKEIGNPVRPEIHDTTSLIRPAPITMNAKDSPASKKTIRFFVSYAHADYEDKTQGSKLKDLRERLEKKLKLSMQYKFEVWDDFKILPGNDWLKKINENLESCDFGLIMVSENLLVSDFVKRVELQRFLDRAKPCIPVSFGILDFSRDLQGLEKEQIFLLRRTGDPSRAFVECTTDSLKNEFAKHLVDLIEAKIGVSAIPAAQAVSHSIEGLPPTGDQGHSAPPDASLPSPSREKDRQLTPEEKSKLSSVFGKQLDKIKCILESNKELRELLIATFGVPPDLGAEEATLHLMVHFHVGFIEALGRCHQLYRQHEQKRAIIEFVGMIMFLAMDADYAERLRNGDSRSAMDIPKDARQGIVSLLACWLNGEPSYPLRDIPKEKEFGSWETLPKDRLPERRLSLMKQHGIDPASPEAERRLKSKTLALKNAAIPAWLVISEGDRDLLPELQQEDSWCQHLLILVATSEATIHSRRGCNYNMNFEDQLDLLLNTIYPTP
ncbi:MAG: SMEK domain-containing protein [Verrucomicrobia bacterium]|nr:SMEK domain-containing protein [Verrucomicrobiota bacterium]